VSLTERAKPATPFVVPVSHDAFWAQKRPELMLQEVLAGFIGDFVLVYLDDVIV